FPGPEETFGQVVLEAMASGLPVIVADRGGPATIVQDGRTGFVCPTDDAAVFAACVRRLYDNVELRTGMGHEGRRDATRRPWLSIMRQLETFYAEALAFHTRLMRRRYTSVR